MTFCFYFFYRIKIPLDKLFLVVNFCYFPDIYKSLVVYSLYKETIFSLVEKIPSRVMTQNLQAVTIIINVMGKTLHVVIT